MSTSKRVGPYPATSHPSELFDSRSFGPGIGFPSLCTDLVPAPRNTRDPHDYYAELGVDPGASRTEIKARLRALYIELHPDTGTDPDPSRLNRVKNIAEVLLDDQARLKYDRTPPGQRLMDKVYAEELSKLEGLRKMSESGVRDALQARKSSPYGTPGRFDYFSIGHRTDDAMRAQQWYHYLMQAASLATFTGRLRLLLWDGDRPAWNTSQEILMVPRAWDPSTVAAKVLVTRVIGNNGISNLNQEAPTLPFQEQEDVVVSASQH